MDIRPASTAFALAMAFVAHVHASNGWEHYPGLTAPGRAGIVIGDFDGDGTAEAAVSASAWRLDASQPTSHLVAVLMAGANGSFDVASMLHLPDLQYGQLIRAPREGVANRLAAVIGAGADSRIVILGDVPLRILRTIQAPMVTQITSIADVDGDGQQEVVALAAGQVPWLDLYPMVLDYETGAIEWLGGDAAADIGVAQLDNDPALELILAGVTGRIVDGASQALEWTWPNGFGDGILTGQFDEDGITRFATYQHGGSLVQMFRSSPYSPESQFSTASIDVAKTVRLSESGPDRIAIGGDQWGSVTVHQARSGEQLFTVVNPGHGVSALEIGDIGAAAQARLVFGPTARAGLQVFDLSTGALEYAQDVETGPFSSIVRGDLAGGGSDQVAYLARDLFASGESNVKLHVLDAATGTHLRSRNVIDRAQSRTDLPIGIGRFNAAARQDIVVAGGDSWGEVALINGATLQDRWRVGGAALFGQSEIDALAVIDVDHDEISDVLVATSSGRLFVLKGTSGSVLWQSDMLGNNGRVALVAFRGANDDPRVVFARGNEIYLIDPGTRQILASTTTTHEVIGVTHLGTGSTCRLGVLLAGSIATLHDCMDLQVADQLAVPPSTLFLRALDSLGTRFVTASEGRIHEVAIDGRSATTSSMLGYGLGDYNQGDLRPALEAGRFELVIGSNYMVVQRQVEIDMLFADGFD